MEDMQRRQEHEQVGQNTLFSSFAQFSHMTMPKEGNAPCLNADEADPLWATLSVIRASTGATLTHNLSILSESTCVGAGRDEGLARPDTLASKRSR